MNNADKVRFNSQEYVMQSGETADMDLIGPMGDLAIIGFGDIEEMIGDDLYKWHITDVLSPATTHLRNE